MNPPPVVVWSEEAIAALHKIGSAAIRQKLALKVDALKDAPIPEQLGKPLQDELAGVYRLTFGRYRMLYQVRRLPTSRGEVQVRIEVAFVGIRKSGDKRDVYVQAQKLR